MTEEEAKAFIEKDNTTENNIPHLANSLQQSNNNNSLVHPHVNYAPKYIQNASSENTVQYIESTPEVLNESTIQTRIQDSHLTELTDSRSCLSMHQPWASLLVYGIKKVEGRSWQTNHRGRLWIASTAQPVSQEAIQEAETYYRNVLYGSVIFPDKYPSGSLLGCVNVTDCCPREEYIARGYHDETDSPFCFICEHPHLVSVQYAVKGKHKIWKLDPHIHNAAKRLLTTIKK